MNLNLLKMNFYSLATSLALISNLHGDWPDENICFTTPSECCNAYQQGCGKIVFAADLLIWRPYQKGLDQCGCNEVIDTVDNDGRVISTFTDKGNGPKFKWTPGFRVGAGYEACEGNWTYGIAWTHFNSHLKRGNQDNNLKWNLDFDTIDALGAYKLSWGNCFTLTPFAGIRTARIDQSIHVDNILIDNIRNRDSEKFLGVGPLIGLGANCKIGINFSLYANAALSWLYGRCNVHLNDVSEFESGSSFFNSKKHTCANQYVTDASLGIQWNTVVCNYEMFVRLGFEHHQYFDYNYLTDGDLSLSGGIISTGFEF